MATRVHDRIIGALELCCRRGEMLLIQNKRVNWETYQVGIPGATAKAGLGAASAERSEMQRFPVDQPGATNEAEGVPFLRDR